ncbi:hypothetical protein Hte_003396 [Hypoxylon texense]
MGTRGLEVVRFRKRYYIRWNKYDSYFEGLGAEIVARIPEDPEEYRKWLQSMRESYAATERTLEKHIYEIHDGSKPDYSLFNQFEELPSELPNLSRDPFVEYIYIINLDEEVLTMNYGIHWKLNNIPRKNNLWIKAIADSIYIGKPTISPDICPEEHMASLALDVTRDQTIGYGFHVVTPKNDITGGRAVFLTRMLTTALRAYKDEIIRLGKEWSPDSFPFRELTFAFLSIASGQADFLSFPESVSHHFKWPGWLNERGAGDKAPLLEFGSMSHRPGDPPGASPTETMYWLEGVLVRLSLEPCGKDVTEAVDWGFEQGCTNFQVVVISLFKVTFAEVSLKDNEPHVKLTKPLSLSPLHSDYCLSTHPRERPECKDEVQRLRYGERILSHNHFSSSTPNRLRHFFPGFVSLVNFFDIAASRRAVAKAKDPFPPEVYDRVLDFVDYKTWKSCLLVSREFRSSCLRNYRIDDRTRIIGSPYVGEITKGEDKTVLRLFFDLEDMEAGGILPMEGSDYFDRCPTPNHTWMPLVGSDRRALMTYVAIWFSQVKPRDGHVKFRAEDDDFTTE